MILLLLLFFFKLLEAVIVFQSFCFFPFLFISYTYIFLIFFRVHSRPTCTTHETSRGSIAKFQQLLKKASIEVEIEKVHNRDVSLLLVLKEFFISHSHTFEMSREKEQNRNETRDAVSGIVFLLLVLPFFLQRLEKLWNIDIASQKHARLRNEISNMLPRSYMYIYIFMYLTIYLFIRFRTLSTATCLLRGL